MARPTTGSVTKHVGKDGLIYRSLRFTAYGKRRRVPLGPVSEADAEKALRHTLADVERGTWRPPAAVETPTEVEIPTFHVFAEEWWVRNEGRYAAKTRTDYRWRLEVHLLPYFAELRLDAITFDTVERYIAAKLAEAARLTEAHEDWQRQVEAEKDRSKRRALERERPPRPLSPRSINMTVILLAAIMESAIERELISRNPAKGKTRRVKERAPVRSYLSSAWQIIALLRAASELDREAARNHRHVKRRAMVSVLVFAGLRIGELVALPLDEIDLAGGWLHTGSKTDAGNRDVKIRGALHDELATVRADATPGQRLAFPTSTGRQMSADNFRSRVLAAVVKRANENLEADGLPPLPDKLTPHSLRRTFCSLLYALGEDPGVVMDELGHTDPGLALRVYRQAMRRGEDEKAALAALVEGGVLATGGQRDGNEATTRSERKAA
jgi:integrase